MQVEMKPLKLVTVITERGRGKKVIHLLNERKFSLHTAFLGRGTAPDELSSYLGVNEPEKTLILLVTEDENIGPLFEMLETEFGIGSGGGIAFAIPLNSASNMQVLKFITGLN